jgi:PST family polysaccharide transporter/lipopolysaccharide exporter
MTPDLTSSAGAALRWRAAQLAGVQLIYFLRLLILARLLAPDAFGLLAIATVALGVMMQLSELGMIPALVQRRDATLEQHDAAWTVGLMRGVLVAGVLVLAAPAIASLFGEPRATPIIQALALRPIIDAGASIGIAQLTRALRFRELALLYVPGAIVDTVTAIATARWLGVWALVAGALAGAATTALLSYALAPHRPRLVIRKSAIAPLVRFGRWVMLTGIVGLAGTTVVQVVLSRSLGPGALGVYFLANRFAFIPATAASTIVGSVAFPLFADLHENAARTAAAFRNLVSAQMIALLPLYGLMFVLAPAFEEVLGPRWTGTAPVMQVLSVAAVTGVFGETLGPLFMGKGQPARMFVLELLQTGLLVAAVWPLVALYGVSGAAAAWLTGNVAALMLGFLWVRRLLAGQRVSDRVVLVAAAVAALSATAIAAVASALLPALPGLIVGAVSGVAAAFLVLIALNRFLRLDLGALARWVRGSSDAPGIGQQTGTARTGDPTAAGDASERTTP